MADKKGELSLNTKTHSSYSIVSFVLSLLGLVLFCSAVITSASNEAALKGTIITIGLLEIAAMMCNLSGFIFGVVGEVIKDYFKLFSHIGLIINGLLLIAHMYVLVFGF